MELPKVSRRDVEKRKQELRAEIARSRRKINHGLFALKEEKNQLTSWKTYVRRFPAGAAAGAFVVGLVLSRGIPIKLITTTFTNNFARGLSVWAVRMVKQRALQELMLFWQNSQNDSSTN